MQKTLLALAWAFSVPAMAAGGYIYDAGGEVNVAIGNAVPRMAKKNDMVTSRMVVTTGDKSYAVLKFEDGQVATMQSNSAFNIREYRYEPAQAAKNSIVFSGFKGGMRFVTGLIGQRNHKAFRLLTPNATIGVRGTEFMVALVQGALYGQVVQGSVSMTNSAGTAVFKAGQSILVESAKTLPKSIPVDALPTGIFSQLDAIPASWAGAAQSIPNNDPSAAVPGAPDTSKVSSAVMAGGAVASIAGAPAAAVPALLPGAAISAAPRAARAVATQSIPNNDSSAAVPGIPDASGVSSAVMAGGAVASIAGAPAAAVPASLPGAAISAAPPKIKRNVALMSASEPRPADTASSPPVRRSSSRAANGAGVPNAVPSTAKYTGADLQCDFCTGRTNTQATHVPLEPDAAAGSAAIGEASLFGKHNLTSAGTATGEICAFCHTPQGAENSVSVPRWNRTASILSEYRAYSSLGSAAQQATGSVSMSCLSCHDGSQAPNIVINTPGLKLNTGNVELQTNTDLRNHHPVGIQYAGGGQNQNAQDVQINSEQATNKLIKFNTFAAGNKFSPVINKIGTFNSQDAAAFGDVGNFSNEGNFAKERFNRSLHSGTGSGTVWWVRPPNSKTKNGRQKTDLYLFTRTDAVDSVPGESVLNQPYVECATCHDPHSTNSTFLRMPGGNSRSQICLTCHNK